MGKMHSPTYHTLTCRNLWSTTERDSTFPLGRRRDFRKVFSKKSHRLVIGLTLCPPLNAQPASQKACTARIQKRFRTSLLFYETSRCLLYLPLSRGLGCVIFGGSTQSRGLA